MIIFYLCFGALTGIAAGVLVGVVTGSILLGVLTVSTVSTAAIFLAAIGVFLRTDRNSGRASEQMVPAE